MSDPKLDSASDMRCDLPVELYNMRATMRHAILGRKTQPLCYLGAND